MELYIVRAQHHTIYFTDRISFDKHINNLNSLNIPYRAERAMDINNISLAKLGIKSEVNHDNKI